MIREIFRGALTSRYGGRTDSHRRPLAATDRRYPMESITKKEELRNESLVTAEELADVLSVSTRQVYRWAANGTIPSRKLSHKVRRFQVKEVVAWLESRRQGPRRAA